MLSSWLTRSAASASPRRKPARGRAESFMVRLGRWTRRTVLFAILSALVALGVYLYNRASYFLYYSSYFEIEEIRVLDVPLDLARELADSAVLRDYRGRNLLLLDAREVAANLAFVPNLADVRVVKDYPNRLVVYAREREPVAIINAEDLFLVDAEGVLLDKMAFDGTQQPDLPYVSGVKIAGTKFGERIDDAQLPVAIDLLGRIQVMNSRLYRRISEVAVNQHDGLTLFLNGGLEVKLGRRDPVELMPALEAYLKTNPALEGPAVISLRFDNQLVVRANGGTGGA